MTNKLRQLFELHGMMGVRKQRFMAHLLGQHSWEYIKEEGRISFSAGQSYQVQVLGTESESSDTWLWSWANSASEIPEQQLQAALALKELGEREGIEELTVTKLPRQRLSSHLLGAVALGVLDKPAYYRAKTEGSALLCLIDDPAFPALPDLKGTELVVTLGDAISNYEFRNHRESVTALLQQLGLTPQWEGHQLTVQAKDGVWVLAHFDERDRLAKLSAKPVLPEPAQS